METLDALLWWTLKGSAILALALAATRLLRRRPAAVRHAIWSVAVLAQVLVPLSDAIPVERAIEVRVPVRFTAQSEWSTAAVVEAEAVPARSTPWMELLIAGGAMLLLLRLAAGMVRVLRMTRRAPRFGAGWREIVQRYRATLRLARPVDLVRCDAAGAPVTWGFLRPAILLPSSAEEWPEDVRRHVLLHELAHVKRGDALTQLAAQAVLALFWFNPLLWLAVRRMRAEAEHACDDYVLRAGERPARYATTLFELVRAHDGAGIPAFAALSVARPSDLEQRVRAITDPARDVAVRRALGIFAIATALVIVLPLSAVQRAAEHVRRFEGRLVEDPAAPPSSCEPIVRTGLEFREASGVVTRGGSTATYLFSRPEADRCVEVLVPSSGEETLVREKRGSVDRILWIRESGARRYAVNGRPAAWDAAAERWYRTLRPEIIPSIQEIP